VNIEAETHTVKILSSRPEIEYSFSGGSAADFTCSLSDLVEFVDRNGSGRVEDGEITRRLDLHDLPWDFVPQNYTKGNNTHAFVYTYKATSYPNATYDLTINLNVYEDPANVTFVVAGENITYSVSGNAAEVKFDIAVKEWPWSTEKTKLALRMRVLANSIRSASNPEYLSQHESGVSFQVDGQTVMVKWVNEARIKLRDTKTETIAAVTVHRNLADERSLEVDFVYPNFMGGSLVHDPSVALGAIWFFEPALNVFVVSIGSGVIAIGLVFYIRYRDRRGS